MQCGDTDPTSNYFSYLFLYIILNYIIFIVYVINNAFSNADYVASNVKMNTE